VTISEHGRQLALFLARRRLSSLFGAAGKDTGLDRSTPHARNYHRLLRKFIVGVSFGWDMGSNENPQCTLLLSHLYIILIYFSLTLTPRLVPTTTTAGPRNWTVLRKAPPGMECTTNLGGFRPPCVAHCPNSQVHVLDQIDSPTAHAQ